MIAAHEAKLKELSLAEYVVVINENGNAFKGRNTILLLRFRAITALKVLKALSAYAAQQFVRFYLFETDRL